MTIGELKDDFDIVKIFLEDKGFSVLEKPHKNENGPDLICHNGKRTYKIEIKKAKIHEDGNSYYCAKLYKEHYNDDYVAIVLPDNNIYVMPMELYVLKINEAGNRFINDIAIIYGFKK
jgi:Holliday junction resolvase